MPVLQLLRCSFVQGEGMIFVDYVGPAQGEGITRMGGVLASSSRRFWARAA